mgnify:CR=1 FL=1
MAWSSSTVTAVGSSPIGQDIILNPKIKHNIDIIIDRLIINTAIKSRLTESVETALQLGNGSMLATINQKKDILFKSLFFIYNYLKLM